MIAFAITLIAVCLWYVEEDLSKIAKELKRMNEKKDETHEP